MTFVLKKYFSIFFLLFTFSFACQGCGNSSSSTSFTYQNTNVSFSGNLVVTAEIADTAAKRSQGLMNRDNLDSDAGMLFVFDESDTHSFWMRNTSISLDIIFINANKQIVFIAESTTPFSEDSIVPSENCLYVLEVNAGFADQNSVSVGDSVTFSL